MAISMLKIRRPLGRLIFNMGIAIPGKTVFLIETAPWSVRYDPITTPRGITEYKVSSYTFLAEANRLLWYTLVKTDIESSLLF